MVKPLPSAIADTFDAMTSDRPYRTSMPADQAVAEIKQCSGTQLDPATVEAFLRIPAIEIVVAQIPACSMGTA